MFGIKINLYAIHNTSIYFKTAIAKEHTFSTTFADRGSTPPLFAKMFASSKAGVRSRSYLIGPSLYDRNVVFKSYSLNIPRRVRA